GSSPPRPSERTHEAILPRKPGGPWGSRRLAPRDTNPPRRTWKSGYPLLRDPKNKAASSESALLSRPQAVVKGTSLPFRGRWKLIDRVPFVHEVTGFATGYTQARKEFPHRARLPAPLDA